MAVCFSQETADIVIFCKAYIAKCILKENAMGTAIEYQKLMTEIVYINFQG